MAEIHRYDSARLQRSRHRDVGQRTLHSQPTGAHLHSARHTMREAAAEESQRPSSDYARGHCAHRDATQKKQNRLRSVTPKPILQSFSFPTYNTICLIPQVYWVSPLKDIRQLCRIASVRIASPDRLALKNSHLYIF